MAVIGPGPFCAMIKGQMVAGSASRVGQQTCSGLERWGFSSDEIQTFIQNKVAVQAAE